MGLPPKRVLFVKLAKKFFKYIVPAEEEEGSSAQGALYACWNKYGYMSEKCTKYVEMMHKEEQQKLKEKQKFDEANKKTYQFAMHMMLPPRDKYWLKGRHGPPQDQYMNKIRLGEKLGKGFDKPKKNKNK